MENQFRSQFRTRIKVCGVTRVEDAVAACELGADALGLNFYPESHRYVDVETARRICQAVPALTDVVAVFVDARRETILEILEATGIPTVQLHGDEPPELVAALAPGRVVKAFRWQGPQSAETIGRYVERCREGRGRLAGVLIDTHRQGLAGGTGETWDWSEAGTIKTPFILAGGLNPTNVAAAVRRVRPFAVDVASGVECDPGKKDLVKLREFFSAVCEADRES